MKPESVPVPIVLVLVLEKRKPRRSCTKHC
jgi:hypothetical protein